MILFAVWGVVSVLDLVFLLPHPLSSIIHVYFFSLMVRIAAHQCTPMLVAPLIPSRPCVHIEPARAVYVLQLARARVLLSSTLPRRPGACLQGLRGQQPVSMFCDLFLRRAVHVE